MTNELDDCKSGLQKCITRMFWEKDEIRHIDEKGCGNCEFRVSGMKMFKPNCSECEDVDGCNEVPTVKQLHCRTEQHPGGKLCQPGENCIVTVDGKNI